MNFQKILSIIFKRKLIEEKNMHSQNESSNKRQTSNTKENEHRLDKEEIFMKDKQGHYFPA
jgi:hypothetical protein